MVELVCSGSRRKPQVRGGGGGGGRVGWRCVGRRRCGWRRRSERWRRRCGRRRCGWRRRGGGGLACTSRSWSPALSMALFRSARRLICSWIACGRLSGGGRGSAEPAASKPCRASYEPPLPQASSPAPSADKSSARPPATACCPPRDASSYQRARASPRRRPRGRACAAAGSQTQACAGKGSALAPLARPRQMR